MRTDETVEYGLRSMIRLKSTEEVITRDFFGPTKGEESGKFIETYRGLVDYQVTHSIPLNG